MLTELTNVDSTRKTFVPLPPLVRKLEQILTLLPRKYQSTELLVDSYISIIEVKRGIFQSLSSTPLFQLIFEPTTVPNGWIYLEAALVRHNGNRVARLYYNLGQGFNESDSIFVPTNLRGTIREVIYLPKGILALRWQPMESAGQFSQSPLIVHKISWLESYYRRAWRVISDLWRFRYLSKQSRDGLSWTSVISNIDKAYAWSAKLRLIKSPTVSYEDYIRRNDTLTLDDIKAMKSQILRLPLKPTFSIVMPVHNPSINFFREALDSIVAQTYPHWQLCLATNGSSNQVVKKIIEEYVRKDARINAISCPHNEHISATSNCALEIASGEFIVLVDQDDLLPTQALYHVAIEINHHPDVCVIYSDEDKLDEFGNRYEPYFKSDWNPELFYSQNMISKLGVYKSSLVNEIGGFRLGYEGSQDYDLALRCISKITADKIRHIPRVLYHWRAHTNANALSNNLKYGFITSEKESLKNHFYGTNIKTVETNILGQYRIIYPLPSALPLVTLIIPTRDQVEVLKHCIESIKNKTDYANFEVLVIDNQSTDNAALDYLSSLSKDSRFRVIKYDKPFNYSAINNYAVSMANGEIIGLINNDIEVINDDWLSEMVRHVLRADVGAVGAKLLYSDNSVQHAGVIIGLGGLANHSHRFYAHNDLGYFGRANLEQELSAVTAACLLVRKSVFEAVGGLDEENLTVAFNDVDFCLKVRESGLRNIYTPYAMLYHHESISRGQEDTPEKQARQAKEIKFMKEKWGATLQNDPFYNPNLTRDKEDFSLASHIVKSPHHGYPLATSV